jgi:acyl-coenzyme A synthetase/AMP-(fatty) acid ligase
VNFARDVVERSQPTARALVEISREGERRVWSFGDVVERSAKLAGALAASGVKRGDVVLTLIGNRPEWVFTMVACFRIGAVVLPCTEQLRADDLRLRIEAVKPRAVILDERNRAVLEAALGKSTDIAVLAMGEPSAYRGEIPDPVELDPEDPCLITFTSGSAGEPKPVLHAQRYLTGQEVQAQHWLAPRPGELVWCTAASGWSKSARNVFIAPWLRGAAGLLHDARFDPQERLEILSSEAVNVLCMAPTEYRMIAKRATLKRFGALRGLVAAGEALNPEVLYAWREATGLEVRDGYGQTETGQMTANPPGQPSCAGSMGQALPGVRMWVKDGELVVDPASVPTFFLGYLGQEPRERSLPWHTGDRVSEQDGYFFFQGRIDDVIISAGYRIGPFEVESALLSHPSVADVAVVGAPDEERGSVVRAVVVLRAGFVPSPTLAVDLQDHVKGLTAPYKYPRIVEFREELPKTSSGKIRRASLRSEPLLTPSE